MLGYDISKAMIAFAHSARHTKSGTDRLCRSSFRRVSRSSRWAKSVNYLFDCKNSRSRLERLFARVHEALLPGGLLVFDVAVLHGRVPGGHRRGYTEGKDWACLFEAREDSQRSILTRSITSFRKDGTSYRRDHEVHRLRLYDRAELATQFQGQDSKSASFRVMAGNPFRPATRGSWREKRDALHEIACCEGLGNGMANIGTPGPPPGRVRVALSRFGAVKRAKWLRRWMVARGSEPTGGSWVGRPRKSPKSLRRLMDRPFFPMLNLIDRIFSGGRMSITSCPRCAQP